MPCRKRWCTIFRCRESGDGAGVMNLEELQAIAHGALRKHGLTEWTFGWARTRRRLGACKYRQKRIEIAAYYAEHNSADKVLDTLLHEIAHALAGPSAKHGPKWKAIAARIGATPKACDSAHDTVVKPGDWQAVCPACQKTFHRYRRPKSLTGWRCRCAARAPLTFRYFGNQSLAVAEEHSVRFAARWEAQCHGCLTVHCRVRKPKPGLWRCRCPQRCELKWAYCPAASNPNE